MPNTPDFPQIFQEISDRLKQVSRPNDALQIISRILQERVPHYDWVGFYLVDRQHPRELILGPFVGAPTEHTRIPFGVGICGQAAEKRELFVVPDIQKETNYLACSPDVQAEIVLPIFKDGHLLGELDIDSHDLAPFTPADEEFLRQVCTLSADWIENL